jgi:MFS family permease
MGRQLLWYFFRVCFISLTVIMTKSFSVNSAIKVLLLFLFFLNITESFVTPLFAVFVTDFIVGATLKTVGFAFASFSIAKALSQIPIARWLDAKKGERDEFLAMLFGAFLSTLFPFSLLLASKPWHLYVLHVILGVGIAFLMAAYYAVYSRHVDKGSEGVEWSFFSVGALTIPAAIGAAVGGVVADALGFRILFIASGIVNAGATVFLLMLYPYLDGVRKKVRIPPMSSRVQK